MAADLHGCLIGVIVAEGADERQLRAFCDGFHQDGARVHYLGVGAKAIRTLAGAQLRTDAIAEEVSPGYYDGLIIPDGRNIQALAGNDGELIALLQAFAEQRRPIGAIGDGVLLLAEAGVIERRKVAANSIARQRAASVGATCVDDRLVADRIFITARDSSVMGAFCARFAEELVAYRKRDYVDETSIESFPGSDPVSGAAI